MLVQEVCFNNFTLVHKVRHQKALKLHDFQTQTIENVAYKISVLIQPCHLNSAYIYSVPEKCTN